MIPHQDPDLVTWFHSLALKIKTQDSDFSVNLRVRVTLGAVSSKVSECDMVGVPAEVLFELLEKV